MQVIRADAMGMCFGVRDALGATERVAAPAGVTIFGELVHNPAVTDRLRDRGFAVTGEAHRDLPVSETVLITAHGISDRQRAAILAAGKSLIDTTCPLVKKAHAAAVRLQREGYHVMVIGKRDHVEVQGLVGDLEDASVVEKIADVKTLERSRLGVICQTTTCSRHAREILDAVIAANPQAQVRFVDTICQPTKDRQTALEQLLDRVDAMVVVGGRHSNNTRELVERSVERGVPAFHVEHRAELRPQWFGFCATVGLTAGTSTLPETIQGVYEALCAMG